MLALPLSLSSYMASGNQLCRFQLEVIFVKRHGKINTRGQFLLSWLEWEEGDTTKNPKMQKTVTHYWVPLSQRQVSWRDDSAPAMQTPAVPEHTRPSPQAFVPKPRLSLHLQCLVLHHLPRKLPFTIQIPPQNLTSFVMSLLGHDPGLVWSTYLTQTRVIWDEEPQLRKHLHKIAYVLN